MPPAARHRRDLPAIPPYPIPVTDVVIEIRADPRRPGGRLVLQDGVESSYVDIADPTRLEFEYQRHLARVIDMVHPKRLPLRMLQIGGGPCAVPRYLDATRKDLRATVVEIDPGVIAVAVDHLGLVPSDRLEVRIGDGRQVLADLSDASLDVVIVDAFDGVVVPHHLLTRQFRQQVRRVLRPGGLHMVNLIDIPPMGLAAAAISTLREDAATVVVLADAETIARRSSGNVVVAATDGEIATETLTLTAGRDPDPWEVLWGRKCDRFVGEAASLDDDVEPQHALAVLGPLFGRRRRREEAE